MKTRHKLGILTFLVALALAAGLFWLAGYDFDSRGPQVASAALVSLVISAFAAAAVAFMP